MGVLFLLMVVGFIAAKCGVMTESGNRMITKLVIYIGQPGLTFSSVLAARGSVGGGAMVGRAFLFSLLLLAVLFLLACAVPVLLRLPPEERGIYRFMAFITNSSFLGLPLSQALFGDTGLFYATIFNIPNGMALYSIGVLMVSGKKGEKLDLKKILNPTLVTSLIALALFFLNVSLPGFIMKTASTLGSICTPGSMLVLGASVGMAAPREVFCDKTSYLFAACKLLLVPLAVWLVLRNLVHDPVLLNVMLLMAALPPAAASTMFAIEYNANVKAASRNVMLSTIFCLVTVPLLAILIFA